MEDFKRAQAFADRFTSLKWMQWLDRLAHTVNPLLPDLLAPMTYYWVTAQAEYATDIVFKSRAGPGRGEVGTRRRVRAPLPPERTVERRTERLFPAVAADQGQVAVPSGRSHAPTPVASGRSAPAELLPYGPSSSFV